MSEPRIKTTVVGSYPVPAWLGSRPTAGALRDAIMVVVKTQELAGIDVISDGELSRFDINHPETNGMIDYFVGKLDGIDPRLTANELAEFRRRKGMRFRSRPAGAVRGPIGEGTLDLFESWTLVKSLAAQPLKFTVTSPYMLAKTLLDTHYHDLRALTMALAEVLARQAATIDCAVFQVDEANLPGAPEDAHWAHEPINRVLGAVRGEKAVHLCFGNYGGQTIQQGRWKDLINFLNRLNADHLVMEVARRDESELAIFRDLRDGLALGVGVIDIKDNEVETPDEVARRIEHAVAVLGADRIRWVHPDCGFWMLPRSVVDRKMEALVEGRDRFLR